MGACERYKGKHGRNGRIPGRIYGDITENHGRHALVRLNRLPSATARQAK